MDKSFPEEHLSIPLQTNKKQFKIAINFLTGYNGIFNVTVRNNKFHFAKSSSDKDGFIQTIIPQGAYELESLNDEIKRIVIEEGYFPKVDYPFKIKPNFSTLGSILEISEQGPLSSFLPDDSRRDLLGFNASTIYEKYHLSLIPVDILSFYKIFLECDNAQGMILNGKRSSNFYNSTTDVDPGYEYTETFPGGVQWYMMESKDII